MAAWWPTVQARLVTLIPTLPAAAGFVVHDGPPQTDLGSPKWISVGFSSVDGSGGSFEMPDGPVDTMREERGTVLVEVVAWSGDDQIAAHRSAVFAVLTALEGAVRADQRLAVLPQSSTVELSAEPVPVRDSNGSLHRLVITLSYFVRS